MRRIEVERAFTVDVARLKFRGAEAGDYDKVVGESVNVVLGGRLAVAFRQLPELPQDLVSAFFATNYGETARTAGLVTRSRVLGAQPRVTIRRDYCTQASMSWEQPAEHAVYLRYARLAAAEYKRADSERYARTERLVSRVLPEWRIEGTPFTSGIVNQDNPLRYHHDVGNFRDGWSCMYAVAHDCAGGLLVLPELRLAFSFERPALIMFDGAGLLHGVTALEKHSVQAWRYSVVFYALQGMCKCLSAQEELSRIRRLRVARENKRAGGG
jgi:hypothetical protein